MTEHPELIVVAKADYEAKLLAAMSLLDYAEGNTSWTATDRAAAVYSNYLEENDDPDPEPLSTDDPHGGASRLALMRRNGELRAELEVTHMMVTGALGQIDKLRTELEAERARVARFEEAFASARASGRARGCYSCLDDFVIALNKPSS